MKDAGPSNWFLDCVASVVGLPLTGSVTVKDAKGVTKRVVLGSSGNDRVHITGMAAPLLLLRGDGMVGGTHRLVHCTSASADQ